MPLSRVQARTQRTQLYFVTGIVGKVKVVTRDPSVFSLLRKAFSRFLQQGASMNRRALLLLGVCCSLFWPCLHSLLDMRPGFVGGFSSFCQIRRQVPRFFMDRDRGFHSSQTRSAGDLPETHNPYVSLLNPFTAPEDVTAGEAVFESRCSQCHGPRGEGGSGPNLSGNFKHGLSDWALYRTITRGIPDTPMQPTDMSTQTAWQVVSYIRHLASTEPNPTASNGAPQSAVDLKFEDLVAADAGSDGWPTYSGSYSGQRHSPSLRKSRLQMLVACK